MKNKLVSIFLVIAIFSAFFAFPAKKVSAQISVLEIGGNLITNIVTTIEQTIGTIEATISAVADNGMWVNETMDRYLVPVLKIAAIEMMNQIISNIVSSGNNGKPMFVTDWNDYLFAAPEKEARVYMNSFFNSVSAGRLSSLNYEGVGQDYDKYLKAQAEISIYGNKTAFSTTIQNYTDNPHEMFSNGNFKAFSAFLDCPNNPYCYSLTAQASYSNELVRLQTVASKEVNQDGYLPKKVNGLIVTPGAQFQSAMEGIDQMANNWFMNATTAPELIEALCATVVTKVTKSLVEGIAS